MVRVIFDLIYKVLAWLIICTFGAVVIILTWIFVGNEKTENMRKLLHQMLDELFIKRK